MKPTSYLQAVLAAAVLSGSAAFGQSSDAILDLLIKKGVINQREANEVREQLDQQTAQTVETYSKVKVPNWIDSLTFGGDLRLRGEYFQYEDIPGTNKKLNADQFRWRYRLRYGVEAKFIDIATVNVRMCSGNGDAVSANQTFNNEFSKKQINIDVASVTLQPPHQDYAKLIAGKMDIPLWQPRLNSPMVYDYDVTPEGIAEQFQVRFGDQERYRLFAQAGQFSVQEFANDGNDVYMFDQQVGLEAKLGGDPKTPKLKMTGAGGYFIGHNFNKLKPVSTSPNLGNTLAGPSGTTNYVGNYEILYFRGEAAWNISDKPFLGTPAVLTISGEYDVNLASIYDSLTGAPVSVTSNDVSQTTGWTGQISFGEAKKKGQWAVAYQYKYLQADAVWDAITDSDWGNGGTDRKGHCIKSAYNLQDWWQIGMTTFITEKMSDRANTGHNTRGFNGENEYRLQADSSFKF